MSWSSSITTSSHHHGCPLEMKDRQRWQPEEDALLRAYVSQHGPKEWSLLPRRMGLSSFHRDPKSCHERWKNYLRPGLRKGSLTGEEQSLVISLQAKHGNKWKLIASHLPGRTPKRLGKWWEVFKQKQIKIDQQNNSSRGETGSNSDSVLRLEKGEYDHILETFADKYVVKKNKEMVLGNGGGSGGGDDGCSHHPVLSLAPIGSSLTSSSACNVTSAHGADMAYSHLNHHHGNHRPPALPQVIPAWMSSTSSTPSTSLPSTLCSMSPAVTGSSPPSVSLSLSPSNPRPQLEIATAGRSSSSLGFQQASILVQLCRDLEEGRQSWMQHKKEANWRLSRLEQQLELEKARKKREKEEEIEAKIRALWEEENSFLQRIDAECRDQLRAIQRDADAKEAKMIEIWDAKHTKLARLVDQFGCSTTSGGARRQHHPSHHHHYQFGNHKDMH